MPFHEEKQRILQKHVHKAVEILRSGQIIAAATETFFGLLADIYRPDAVNRIKELKGIHPEAPMLVIVRSFDDAEKLVETVPPEARSLAEKYWPGPLTMIFKARRGLRSPVVGHYGTIAIRMPGPSDAAEILKLFRRPLTATSCNPHGQSPAITGRQATEMFKGKVDFIVPGTSPGGLPSTILDVTVNPPVVNRRGIIGVEGKFLRG